MRTATLRSDKEAIWVEFQGHPEVWRIDPATGVFPDLARLVGRLDPAPGEEVKIPLPDSTVLKILIREEARGYARRVRSAA